MNGADGQTLQNVLSISTAANNRYLFHFNSLNSLTQWTAGIRLAMFEHSSLQEAYTGSLIAGKGKYLNNIRSIMDRTKFVQEDWARVRFGAGTPWRRCWYVITPPDEKEYGKLQKQMKKRNPYEKAPVLKGTIKFYDSNKIKKKTTPIATMTDAYSAYAIYPQSKPLIDQSTLVKMEGNITIHTSPETSTEGFLFVMPEVHAAVSGFEMLLRFLFPMWDIFSLYGRPNKLVADPIDSKGLMFALPTDRRYGYLEILDVAGLIHTKGSQNWNERQWRSEMKSLTSTRMMTGADEGPGSRTNSTRRLKGSRSSLPGSRGGVRFGDEAPVQSEPNSHRGSPAPRVSFDRPNRSETAPPIGFGGHGRSLSEQLNGARGSRNDSSNQLPYGMTPAEGFQPPPQPPPHRDGPFADPFVNSPHEFETPFDGREGSSPESDDAPITNQMPDVEALSVTTPPPAPVAAPPNFAHAPSQKPPVRPQQPPQFRDQAAMDDATLSQIRDANRGTAAGQAAAGAMAAWHAQTNGRQYHPNGPAENVQNNQNYLVPAEQQQMRQNSASPRYRTTTARLPTIPASPYIDQAEPSPRPSYFEPAPPPVPEHGEDESPAPPPHGSELETGAPLNPELNRSGSSYNINRKPVGGLRGTSNVPRDDASSSSLGSLTNAIIDQNTLEYIGMMSDGRSSLEEEVRPNAESSLSPEPDYASTRSADSGKSHKSVERPRPGVLRSVGSAAVTPTEPVVIGDTAFGVGEAAAKPTANDSDFQIDFGRTYAVTAGSRPGTSGGLSTHLDDKFAKQPTPGKTPPGTSGSQGSGSDSYFTRSKGSLGSNNANGSPASLEQRNVAWQPGMAQQPGALPQSEQTLTAEQWVQQRAAIASQPRMPTYGHARNKSSAGSLNRLASNTPPFPPADGQTPPLSRNPSGDWNQMRHSRVPSRELLQAGDSRPSSRGSMLNPAAERPISRHSPMPREMIDRPPSRYSMGLMTPTIDLGKLNAREREQVARSTGTPLLNM